MNVFSIESRQKIKEVIAEVEGQTSGEIVPVIVPASSDYRWLKSALFLRGMVVALILIEIVNFLSSWPIDFPTVIMVSVAGGVLASLAGFIPAVARWVIGAEALDEAVQDRARETFMREGMMETRDRTGILIFISRFEHEIVILADRGIHEKLGQKYWDELCAEYVTEVRAGREMEGLCAIIRRAGDQLAKHFPRRPDDKNELSNDLRGRPGGSV